MARYRGGPSIDPGQAGGSGGGGAPSGSAGGDLGGTYPNPTVVATQAGAVTATSLATSAVDVSTTKVTGTLAAGRFPALTGDITTSAGSLATTIANAAVALTTKVTGLLPVANGGTGIGTLTGLVLGNGTSAMSAVTAPAGTVVGTTDTQTLTNKTVVPVVASALTDASTTAWNADNGTKFTLLATSGVGNTRALGDPSGTVRDGRAYQLRYTQDGSGGRALTVSGTGVKIATALGGGTTVPLDTTASAINLITMIADGTTLYVVSVARLA